MDQSQKDRIAFVTKHYMPVALVRNRPYDLEIMNMNAKVRPMQYKINYYYGQLREANPKRFPQYIVKTFTTPVYQEQKYTYCVKHSSTVHEVNSPVTCLTKDSSLKKKVCQTELVKGVCNNIVSVEAADLCIEWYKSKDGAIKCKKNQVFMPMKKCLDKDGESCTKSEIIEPTFYCQKKFDDGRACQKGSVVYGKNYELNCATGGKNKAGECISFVASKVTGAEKDNFDPMIEVPEAKKDEIKKTD